MDEHARFEQFALTHVLGGLARGDSDLFRTHLRACDACRARVAELRGISSALDAAAREERRRVVQAVVEQSEGPASARRARDERGRSVRVALLVALLAVSAVLGFWNLHLRSSSATYLAVAEERAAILRDLAAGDAVPVADTVGTGARIAVSGPRIVLVLTDAGPLGSDERLVAWLQPAGSAAVDRLILAVGPRADVEVAVRMLREGAQRLVVTRETGLLSSSGPRGVTVLDVALPFAGPGT
jgi:anti-sigma factor RsiW